MNVLVETSLIRSSLHLSQSHETTLVHGAAAVDVLDGGNRVQHRILIDRSYASRTTASPTGQGTADHDSVNGTILVELVDLVLHLLRFTGGIELDFVEIHTAAQSQLLLLLNETLSISIVTKTDQR